MIYMELTPSTLLGLWLAMASVMLYFIRIKKPTISKDYDLFFSSVGSLCGGILVFQGWRLDPILLLCQMMSGGIAIFFIAETLWLRYMNTESNITQILHFNEENNIKTSNTSLTLTSLKKTIVVDIVSLCQKNPLQESLFLINDFNEETYTIPIDYYE